MFVLLEEIGDVMAADVTFAVAIESSEGGVGLEVELLAENFAEDLELLLDLGDFEEDNLEALSALD
jgi:hypothetical protein